MRIDQSGDRQPQMKNPGNDAKPSYAYMPDAGSRVSKTYENELRIIDGIRYRPGKSKFALLQ
ncbi:MAG: hypothetical protein LIO94_10690 [Clostridiales bacterium]|nr:hypothetical protein [Clostridiales bacterium]